MPARHVLSAAVLAVLALSAAGADDQLTDPTPFEVAYGLSFYDFDACGDAEAGSILRRAIVEKLERCPFSPQARARFGAWRLETAEGLLSQLLSNQDGSPVGPPEVTNPTAPMTCERYRSTPRYVDRRADMLRYAKREMTVDQLLGADCPSGPASL
jgi:hypothetical protein